MHLLYEFRIYDTQPMSFIRSAGVEIIGKELSPPITFLERCGHISQLFFLKEKAKEVTGFPNQFPKSGNIYQKRKTPSKQPQRQAAPLPVFVAFQK